MFGQYGQSEPKGRILRLGIAPRDLLYIRYLSINQSDQMQMVKYQFSSDLRPHLI